jgi:CRP-like cAMP-binding protein
MHMAPEDWALVNRAPIFRGMGEEVTRAMLRNRGPRRYERGEQVFQQGDPADAFFMVLDGWVKLYRELPNGEHVVVAMFTKGETFAEAAMFLGGRYHASAEAVAPTRLVHVDGHVLRSLILRNPQIAFDMLAAASLHLKRLVEQIEQLKVRSAPERIADFLLAQVTVRHGKAEVALPYEKALIANRLGMKPESFSRALAKLREFGVMVEREHVVIEDVARLAALTEHSPEEAGPYSLHDRPRPSGRWMQ